jgi:PAS domain S-box-containing protein
MPKKQKIDKRLDSLFKNIHPEDTSAATVRKPKFDSEVQPLASARPDADMQAQSVGTLPAETQVKTDLHAASPGIKASTPIKTARLPEIETRDTAPDSRATMHPTPSGPAPVEIPPPPSLKPVKRHTATLVPPDPEILKRLSEKQTPSDYSINFQTGPQDWATLRVLDETKTREWTSDEQLLVRQVVDQLSIALENARLFQETLERNKQLAALNEEIKRFQLGIEKSDDAIFVTDPQGNIEFANSGFEKVYGYRPEEVVGRNPRILKSGLIDQEQYKQFWDALLGGGTVTGEITNKHRDGRLVTIAGTTSPILDEFGKILGFLAVHHDMTKTKQAEMALAKSEADLRALFTSMEDVVLVYDQDGRYVRIAPTNPSKLIRPPEELLGKSVHEVLPKGLADKFLDAIRQTLSRGENTQLEYDLQVGEDTFWFLASLSKLDEHTVFWIARDITERKKSEEVIRLRNEYLGVSAEIGKLVTSTLDLNTIFTRSVQLINERFQLYHTSIFIVEETGFNVLMREATGAAGEQLRNQRYSLPVKATTIIGKVALEGTAYVANDARFDPLFKLHPLLPETRAEATLPLRIGSRIIGVVDMQATTTDAFPEDEVSVLQTLADQIAIAIDNARSYELSQEAVKEMRETDRVRSQFLANMSHELRTPLNSIIGFSRVILKGIDGPVTELQQQDLTAIYNSGQHLLSLINDILDLAKIEAGKMELAFDEVNMADVTTSVISTISGLVKDKPISLMKEVEPNLPTARADAIRVRQVMINLLSNAAKFTEEGDIIVKVGLKASPTGRMEIQVSVTDTGPGISKEDQAKLFQAFSQVDDSPTRKTGGTGLGLSISQHLINMHGGRIWVESEPGKGSTFTFTLPLYRKDRETAAGYKLVLAIDDDPQVIGLYERYLQPQDYQVIPLTDPSRALERVKQLRPYAVTLDIMMPGVDGWQVLETLKKDPETRDIPVIICSIIDDQERGYSLGAADYLTKPILEEDLVHALDRLNPDGSIRDVLVIDDDPNHLRLLGKILNDDGRYKPTLIEGGKTGWDLISSGNPPHAVILDLFMPDMDGFMILENMRADDKLRDIPVIVISGMDLTAEQKDQLNQFGQRLLSKGSFTEKDLLTTLQKSLERLQVKDA